MKFAYFELIALMSLPAIFIISHCYYFSIGKCNRKQITIFHGLIPTSFFPQTSDTMGKILTTAEAVNGTKYKSS